MTDAMYCPSCGSASLVTVDNRLYGCARCGYTYFHNTAAAVSAVIQFEETIAWITRANEPGRGLLDLPGGFVEGDESLEEAVVRESREEIGLTLAHPRYLFSLPNRYVYHGIGYHTVDAFFAFSVTARPAFTANDEASALHWLKLSEIDPLSVAFTSTRMALARLRDPR